MPREITINVEIPTYPLLFAIGADLVTMMLTKKEELYDFTEWSFSFLFFFSFSSSLISECSSILGQSRTIFSGYFVTLVCNDRLFETRVTFPGVCFSISIDRRRSLLLLRRDPSSRGMLNAIRTVNKLLFYIFFELK